jgi:hypothetical protein
MSTHTIRPHSIAGTEHCRLEGVRHHRILDAHRHEDGTLDVAGLIIAAVNARKDVQNLERVVNVGGVRVPLRERLVCLQQIDIDHRRVLVEHVPGWEAALDEARKDYPRCQMAKVMIRAARSMGLWSPVDKGPR